MSLLDFISVGKKGFKTVEEATKKFEKLNASPSSKVKTWFKEDLPKYIGGGIALGIFGAMGMGGVTCAMYMPDFKREAVPMYGGMMNREEDREITAREMSIEDRKARFEILGRRMNRAQDRLSTMNNENPEFMMIFDSDIFVAQTHLMNPRFVSAFSKSCYINQDEARKGYEADKQERESPVFTPSFMETWLNDLPKAIHNDKKERERVMAVAALPYLRKLAAPNRPIVDAYALYFAGEDNLRKAIAQTGCINYYPDLDENGSVLSKGYREAIPEYQRALIEDADLLYEISDEDKKINWGRLSNYRGGGR